MGSESDLPVMKDAQDLLEEFNIPSSIGIVSAHRTTHKMVAYAQRAKSNGIRVIIAGAGGAAHLPGMIASLTTIPVIGVPIKTKSLDGLDSLLSIAQMPPGVPVATVAINGAKNAAILACQILALSDPVVASKVYEFKKNLEATVLKKARRLQKVGVVKYLKSSIDSK
jgi:phosphoribosylaminoimidazole carboxylase PurE protein